MQIFLNQDDRDLHSAAYGKQESCILSFRTIMLVLGFGETGHGILELKSVVALKTANLPTPPAKLENLATNYDTI